MKRYYILILLSAALGFSGCESDTPSSSSTNSVKKELEIVPASITVTRYQEFKIKARMTNIPMSDVYMHYDFGDGRGAMDVFSGSSAFHFYTDSGNYTITVKAYDWFTDSLLATKIIPARANELPHNVAFSPGAIDTAMECDEYGKLPRIYFTVYTNAPGPKFIWNLEDGTDDTASSNNNFIIYSPKVGTYKLRVDVYDEKDTYWGSDTLVVRISQPNVSATMLQNTKQVSVCYGPDASSPIFYANQNTNGRFDAGLLFKGDSTTSSWYGATFDLQYIHLFSDTNKTIKTNYQIGGKISSDFQRIEKVTVTMFDTATPKQGEICNRWGFTLKGLELVGVNNNMIIYRIVNTPSTDFATGEYFQRQFQGYRPNGFPNNVIYTLINSYKLLAPYGLLVFTR